MEKIASKVEPMSKKSLKKLQRFWKIALKNNKVKSWKNCKKIIKKWKIVSKVIWKVEKKVQKVLKMLKSWKK